MTKPVAYNSNGRAAEICYLTFNFFSTVAVTFINKICFSRVDFVFPAALCSIHYLVTLLGVEILHKLNVYKKVNDISLRDPNFVLLAIVVGVVTPLNNTSLKLNSIGFYQIFKLLLTPCVVVLEYILDGKTISMQRLICLVAVCIGVFISSHSDLEFSPYGTLCALVWIPFAAIYKVNWGRVKRMYNCSTLGLMRAILPYSIIVQAAISPLVDPPGLLDYEWTKEACFWIGLSGLFAFLVNFSGFLVMGNIGALAHILLGQLKTALIMVGATIIFHQSYSIGQIGGAAGAIVFIIYYSHVTIKENVNNDEKKTETRLPLVNSSSNERRDN